MKYQIISFSNSDLDPEIRHHQKRVFDKFQIPLTQIVWEKNYAKYVKPSGWYNDHIYFLQKVLNEGKEDYLLFFDVDCIPLNSLFLPIILTDIADDNTLSGALQSSHFGEYVGAYFVGVSRRLYLDCGGPSLVKDETDPFQELTNRCRRLNKKIKYWLPTHSQKNDWYIPSIDKYYGYGTTFEDMIYHQFQIRNVEQHSPFINKCKEVLQQ